MSKTEKVMVRLPESVNEDIESELDYGDSKAEWVREACRQKLKRDGDEAEQPDQ